jgi:hypothetical protein
MVLQLVIKTARIEMDLRGRSFWLVHLFVCFETARRRTATATNITTATATTTTTTY